LNHLLEANVCPKFQINPVNCKWISLYKVNWNYSVILKILKQLNINHKKFFQI
jgi:hypothetical protein